MAADSTHCCCRRSTFTPMDSGDSEQEENKNAMVVVTETDSESPDPTLPLPTDASPEAKPMETEDKNKGDPTSNQDKEDDVPLPTNPQPASLPTKSVFSMIPPGTKAEAKTEYELKDREAGKGAGVIVVVRNGTFEYKHRDVNWRDEKRWDYKDDIKLLEEVLKFKSIAAADGAPTLLRRNDLTGKEFDEFISEELLKEPTEGKKTQDKLTKIPEEKPPSFLMFFLMSTGFEDGTFLMTDTSQRSRSCCPNDVHTQNGKCHERSVIKHVIQRVQGSKRFSGVPKVFIIQTLKRVRAEPGPASKAAPSKVTVPKAVTEADFYAPKCSDTLVLYSCMEMHANWESKEDPFVIRAFCNKVHRLREKIPEGEQAMAALHELLIGSAKDDTGVKKMHRTLIRELNEHLKVTKGFTSLSLTPESLTDGWLTSICQQTAATVVNFIHKKKGEDPHADDKLRSLYEDKQRPIMSSTLRYGFSMVKLLDMLT